VGRDRREWNRRLIIFKTLVNHLNCCREEIKFVSSQTTVSRLDNYTNNFNYNPSTALNSKAKPIGCIRTEIVCHNNIPKYKPPRLGFLKGWNVKRKSKYWTNLGIRTDRTLSFTGVTFVAKRNDKTWQIRNLKYWILQNDRRTFLYGRNSHHIIVVSYKVGKPNAENGFQRLKAVEPLIFNERQLDA